MFPAENRSIIYENLELDPNIFEKKLRIIHFNDVYNIEEGKEEPLGGAARFYTALNEIKEEGPALVLFSGDALSPSTMSVFSKGQQMIDCLNQFGIHAAAIGNHEFDMGLDELESLIEKSNFPWLLSNVFDADTEKPLLNVQTKCIVEIDGIKVGLYGLGEKEWVCSLSCVDFDDLIYKSYVEISREISKELREEGADIVIALTHMRWRNDEKLAKKVKEIDLILGGHDHDYEIREGMNQWIIKSGSDFKEFSIVELDIGEKIQLKKIEKVIIDSNIPANEKVQKIVDNYLEITSAMLEKELGFINIPLDGRYNIIRTQETNLGNFFCDILMSAVNADCALLNGGAFRSDRIHPKGSFTLGDLRDILSFESELIVLEVTGEQLHQVLEHGVYRYEDIGGRYPQVSGIFYGFDPSKPPGERVNKELIKVQNQYLKMTKTYHLATNTFMKNVDDILKKSPVKVSHENIAQLHTLVENYFKSINNHKNNKLFKHQPSIVSNYDRKQIIHEIGDEIFDQPKHQNKRNLMRQLSFHSASLLITKTQTIKRNVLLKKDLKIIKDTDKYKYRIDELRRKSLDLQPHIENRSILLNNEKELELLAERKRNMLVKQMSINLH